ncbi:MAG: hypothetical protein VKK04_08450 [Synechococcales bacterium]|nr:hypothetical protein [Synechococcales bacterium]
MIDEQTLLQLPASVESIQLQLRRIRDQYRRLEQTWGEIPRLQRQYRRSPEQDLWQRAWEVARAMLLYVEMLIHLAEEHGADPAGTVACLNSIQIYRQSYLQTLTNLQDAIAHFHNTSPIHRKLLRWRQQLLGATAGLF